MPTAAAMPAAAAVTVSSGSGGAHPPFSPAPIPHSPTFQLPHSDPSAGKGCGCWIGQPERCNNPDARWVGGGRANASGVPAPAQPAYNDSSWALVDTPHDMMIGQDYTEDDSGSGNSYLPRAVGWYRKVSGKSGRLTLPPYPHIPPHSTSPCPTSGRA